MFEQVYMEFMTEIKTFFFILRKQNMAEKYKNRMSGSEPGIELAPQTKREVSQLKTTNLNTRLVH